MFALIRLHHGGGAERKEADHRSDPERHGATVRQPEDIIVETVFFIPKSGRPAPIRFIADAINMK